MENVTDLIPKSARRNLEEMMLVMKVIQHIRDYIKAVKKYGSKFYAIPLQEDKPYKKVTATQASKIQAKNQILADGRSAYHYIFFHDDNDFGLEAVCELLDFNASVFKHRLHHLTQKEAKIMDNQFLRGMKKIKQEEAEEKKNAGRV